MSLSDKYYYADLNAARSYARREGREETVFQLIAANDLSPEAGARFLGISAEELNRKMLDNNESLEYTMLEIAPNYNLIEQKYDIERSEAREEIVKCMMRHGFTNIDYFRFINDEIISKDKLLEMAERMTSECNCFDGCKMLAGYKTKSFLIKSRENEKLS